MSKTIKINPLDPASIKAAIKEVKRYKKHTLAAASKIAEKLAKIGHNGAIARFHNAQYDGNNDVEVDHFKDGNRWVIRAHGKAVCFIEFGTGVYYNETNTDYPLHRPAGLAEIGEFGTKGKDRTWAYYGEPGTNGIYLRSNNRGDLYLTYGNPANWSMYYTAQELRDILMAIAKEVLTDDV